MWDFSFAKSVWAVLRTMPFLLLRLAVYFGIAVGYAIAIGTGALLGFAIGHFWASPDAPLSGAGWGALGGFGLTSVILYLLREYLLYLVKAGHIAVLVEVLDGKPVPEGQSQLGYGIRAVEAHFAEASVLFGVDQVIKAVLRVITRTLAFIGAFLPIPGVAPVIRFGNAVIRMSLTYVDEVILAYLIRTRTTNPWQTGQDAVILYAQNYKHFLKNAVWLSLFMWGVTALIFVVLMGPAAGLTWLMPGPAGTWSLGIALIFAIALQKALLEPLAIASLMQVFFATVEGQTPDPEWSARLSSLSRHFRQLGERASGYSPRTIPPPAAAAGPTPSPAI
jgi:hypothetical protein